MSKRNPHIDRDILDEVDGIHDAIYYTVAKVCREDGRRSEGRTTRRAQGLVCDTRTGLADLLVGFDQKFTTFQNLLEEYLVGAREVPA